MDGDRQTDTNTHANTHANTRLPEGADKFDQISSIQTQTQTQEGQNKQKRGVERHLHRCERARAKERGKKQNDWWRSDIVPMNECNERSVSCLWEGG